MAAFLSDEWLDELAVAARDDEELRAATSEVSLTVQQVVTGATGGDVAWYVRFADGKVEIGAGRAAAPDVVITESLETAVEVSRGRLTPAGAFASGRLRLGGDLGLLVQQQRAFDRLARAMAAVHERTTYP